MNRSPWIQRVTKACLVIVLFVGLCPKAFADGWGACWYELPKEKRDLSAEGLAFSFYIKGDPSSHIRLSIVDRDWEDWTWQPEGRPFFSPPGTGGWVWLKAPLLEFRLRLDWNTNPRGNHRLDREEIRQIKLEAYDRTGKFSVDEVSLVEAGGKELERISDFEDGRLWESHTPDPGQRLSVSLGPGYAGKAMEVHWEKLEDSIELQSYGDSSYRDTNYFRQGYNGVAGWFENRWILKPTAFASEPLLQRLLPRPYLKLTLAASGRTHPWENTFVWGGGAELRPLEKTDFLAERPWLEWMQSFRLYGEYLGMREVRRKEEWRSNHDVRGGIDIWKEWGIAEQESRFPFLAFPPGGILISQEEAPTGRREYRSGWSSLLWGELYGNLAYYKTNFFTRDYRSAFFVATGKFGVKLLTGVMPYLTAEIDATGKPFFWENRAILGAGIRFMPMIRMGSSSLYFRIFVEYTQTIDYLRGDPVSGTPRHDIRVGVNFSRNRY